MATEVHYLETGMTTYPLEKLVESEYNARKTFDKQEMADLVASIKERGVQVPLIVRSNIHPHEVVDGARRFRAAKEAGLKEVPVILRQLSTHEAMEVSLIANVQRAGIHPLEEAIGFKNLYEPIGPKSEHRPLTIHEIAAKVGKPVAYVTRRIQLNNLTEPIKKLFTENKINLQHAMLCARLQPEQQKECLPWLKRGDSPQGLAGQIERTFFLILKQAPFDTTDAKLVGKAGSCVECPKRTGFNKALFEDVRDADTCTDPSCYDGKTKAFIKIQIAAHKDAIHLSIGQTKTSQVVSEWRRAGDKSCPDTAEGILVEIHQHWAPEYQQGVKLGQVVKICDNVKCKTHNPRVVRDYNPQTGGSREAERKRKLELKVRGRLFKELSAKSFKIDQDDERAILEWCIRQLGNDDARAVCAGMGWEAAKGKYVDKDFHATISTNLKDLDASGVRRWIYLTMLGASEVWFPNNCGIPKASLLESKIKDNGISLAEIKKLFPEKKRGKAKPAKPSIAGA